MGELPRLGRLPRVGYPLLLDRPNGQNAKQEQYYFFPHWKNYKVK